VSKRGKAKVRIVAVREKPKTLRGALKGSFKIVGDIVGPTIEDHDAFLDHEWRTINGQFDDPPARYTRRDSGDGGIVKAGKRRASRVQRRSRGK